MRSRRAPFESGRPADNVGSYLLRGRRHGGTEADAPAVGDIGLSDTGRGRAGAEGSRTIAAAGGGRSSILLRAETVFE